MKEGNSRPAEMGCIGKTSDLHLLRGMLEAGRKYETMGHTMLCKKAFPPRWEGDNGRNSRAQSAVDVWTHNSHAMTSAKALHDAFTPDWKQSFPRPEACRLENMTTGDIIEVEKGVQPHAWLIAILKVLISNREKEEGSLCAGCGRPSVKICAHDCGEAPCGSPLCSRCSHVTRGSRWYHSGPILGS